MNFKGRKTEMWTTYYDIFVHHAFGNYRDIMREVAASPLMGEYLTFEGNIAYAADLSRLAFPDENFARELMQLFTIGLWEQNMDGSYKLNAKTGKPIDTYTQDNIRSFAKVWTGYKRQPVRGNIQILAYNRVQNVIDPMDLDATKRDKFPKSRLDGGYLADNYPLCANLPPQSFLRKGSTYRYDGPISMYGQLYDGNHTNIRDHFEPDPSKSLLYKALCKRAADGKKQCTFPTVVVLPETLKCNGDVECKAEIVGPVKIVDGEGRWAFYRYQEPACARLQFWSDGRLATSSWASMCADPNLAGTIGTACCHNDIGKELCPDENGGEFQFYEAHTGQATHGDVCREKTNGWQWRCPKGCAIVHDANGRLARPYCSMSKSDLTPCHLDRSHVVSDGGDECLYLAEPMSYNTANARCKAEYGDAKVCGISKNQAFQRFQHVDGYEYSGWQSTCSAFQWTWGSDRCSLQVQVFPSSEISLVDPMSYQYMYKVNNKNKFAGEWGPVPDGEKLNFPSPENGCTHGCRLVPDQGGSCLCDIEVEDVAVFTNASETLPTEKELRSKLWIGSVPPSEFGAEGSENGYTLCTTLPCKAQAGVRVYTRGTSASPKGFGVDAIFELTETSYIATPSTRRPAKYLRNRESVVNVGHGYKKEYVMVEGVNDYKTATPCGDAGFEQVETADECLHAGRAVVPDGDTVETKLSSGVKATMGEWGHMPIGCTMEKHASDEDHEWRLYFNAGRCPGCGTNSHQGKFPAICRKPSKSKAKAVFKFRNPPSFLPNANDGTTHTPGHGHKGDSSYGDIPLHQPYSDGDHILAAATHEKEALLDHLFEHSNTPVFVAYRMIQRMVTSNPSPRYVEAVSTAFETGTYNGKTYSGEYGDMGATVAAVMLDREARATILDADPKHGGLREPLLKVLHLLRSMEFKTKGGKQVVLSNMHTRIGQQAFMSPSVFNYYLPEFVPAGAVANAELVSPESQLATAPLLIGYLNGIASLFDFGLTDCGQGAHDSTEGFGDNNFLYREWSNRPINIFDCSKESKKIATADAALGYTLKNPSNPALAVDELAIVLTGGRLSKNSRQVIVDAYEMHLSEILLDVASLMAKEKRTNSLGDKWNDCQYIYDAEECCNTYNTHSVAWLVAMPNCVPIADSGDGKTCGSEAIEKKLQGSSGGTHIKTCGKIPHASISSGFNSQKATDGKVGAEAQQWTSGSCIHTAVETDPWFQLNLAQAFNIQSITIHNRGDCCGDQTVDVYVDGKKCAANIEMATGDVARIPCAAKGTVVKIVRPGSDHHLIICEVEVNIVEVPDSDGNYASDARAEFQALKHALKLFAIAPEFHTSNQHETLPVPRPEPPKQKSLGRDYKAVVVLFLEGGADSFNMVVPHSDCKAPKLDDASKEEAHDFYTEYQSIRGIEQALPKGKLLPIDVPAANKQPCQKFGLHPELQDLKKLYDEEDLLIFANAGALIEPLTIADYAARMKKNAQTKKIPPGIFGHNTMQKNARTCHAEDGLAKGVLARMIEASMTQDKPMKSAMYSTSGYARMLAGSKLAADIVRPGQGIQRFREYLSIADDIDALFNNKSQSIFGETYSDVFKASITSTEYLGKKLEETELKHGNTWSEPEGGLDVSRQLKEVAKLIQLDTTEFNMERAAYYTKVGGWDSHASVDIGEQLRNVNNGIKEFAKEMKDQGQWDNVAVIVVSDFGRTLTANHQGTDHGWGGNYFATGGSIKGKQMLGKFPSRFTEFESDVNIGRGQILPTTPWEAIWNGVSEWWGFDADERKALLPHAENFEKDAIFTAEQMFV